MRFRVTVLRRAKQDVREMFKTRRGRVYRAVFTIVGDEVRILRVRGPGRTPLTTNDVEH